MRHTTKTNVENESPWRIPQFIFTAPRSVLLQIKFVFQFFIASFSRFTIFLAAPTSSSDFIIHEWGTMSLSLPKINPGHVQVGFSSLTVFDDCLVYDKLVVCAT